MKRIALISCGSSKGSTRAKAKDLYLGNLFINSLLYSKTLKPDKTFILSAFYHLLDLEEEIEPYDVTLSYVPPKIKVKKPNLKVLSREEAKLWGRKVLEQLGKVADLKKDRFILIGSKSYIKPLHNGLNYIEEPLKGLSRGKQLKFLKNQIMKSQING